eukprot:10783275-Alexandrium_andersonii.AAC.1
MRNPAQDKSTHEYGQLVHGAVPCLRARPPVVVWGRWPSGPSSPGPNTGSLRAVSFLALGWSPCSSTSCCLGSLAFGPLLPRPEYP